MDASFFLWFLLALVRSFKNNTGCDVSLYDVTSIMDFVKSPNKNLTCHNVLWLFIRTWSCLKPVVNLPNWANFPKCFMWLILNLAATDPLTLSLKKITDELANTATTKSTERLFLTWYVDFIIISISNPFWTEKNQNNLLHILLGKISFFIHIFSSLSLFLLLQAEQIKLNSWPVSFPHLRWALWVAVYGWLWWCT